MTQDYYPRYRTPPSLFEVTFVWSNYEKPFVDLGELKKQNQQSTIATMKREGLDAIVVTATDSVRYLTCEKMYHENDWWQDHYGAILTSDGQFWAETAHTEAEDSTKNWPIFPFIAGTMIPERWAKLFKSALDRFGVRPNAKIGLDQLSFNVAAELKKQLPSTNFVPFLKQFLEQRAVKNELEIKLLREAARVTDIGLQVGLAVGSTPGVRENEVFAKIMDSIYEAGSEVSPHNSMISSGRASLKEWLISDRRIGEGEFFVFDHGCMIDGYHGDAMRTGFCGRGKPSAELKELYRTIHGCFQAGLKKMKPGVRGSEIDDTCRNFLKQSGYPVYGGWCGHGIGARETEYPMLAPASEISEFDMELKPGMVIGFEVKTQKAGVSAAALEDMILITDEGFERLTKTGYLDELL